MHSLNPSFDNSSRRDIFITIENKKLSSNRNSKSNSTMKYNLITSDKKKKNSKNSISSIEIYDKKKRQNGNDNKPNKQYNEINEKNEDAQTIINNSNSNIQNNNNYNLNINNINNINNYRESKGPTYLKYSPSKENNKMKKKEIIFKPDLNYEMLNNYKKIKK